MFSISFTKNKIYKQAIKTSLSTRKNKGEQEVNYFVYLLRILNEVKQFYLDYAMFIEIKKRRRDNLRN